MKSNFTILYTTSLLLIINLCLSLSLNAQTVIWQEGFSDGDIPDDWVNTDASNQVVDPWFWSDEFSTIPGQPAFTAQSALDGFMVFDSDSIGSLNQNHDVRLTTDAIDCSSLNTVIVHFENQYAYFSNNSQAMLGVSTDSINFTYYPLFANVPINDITYDVQIEEINVTAQAAGQTKVYLQFRWVGNFEYAWRLDDIKVQDGLSGVLGNDLVLSTAFTPLSYSTPQNQLDVVTLGAEVSNIGFLDQTNVNLNAKITAFGGAVYYDNNMMINTLVGGYQDSLVEFSNVVLPALPLGRYNLTYILTQDSTDITPNNNTFSFDFVVSDTTFANDNGSITNGIAGGSSFDGVGAFKIGNVYHVAKARRASYASFAISNPTTIIGETVSLSLYQLDVNGDGNIDENNDQVFNTADIANGLVGFASYTFNGNESANELLSVALQAAGTPNAPVDLVANSDYMLLLEYGGMDTVFIAATNGINYSGLSVVRVAPLTDIWSFNGYPNGEIPVVRLQIYDPLYSSTTPLQVLPNYALTLSPNPTTDYINAKFDLAETSQKTEIRITNLQGQLVQQHYKSNLQQETLNFEVQNLPIGTYFFSVYTDNGFTTKRFVVVR